MKKTQLLIPGAATLFLLVSGPALAASSDPIAPLLLREPTLSQTSVVFTYAGDLWSAPREGGEAHRLTSDVGKERNPRFSPDGSQVAFSAEYDGNTDVFVVPAAGGMPRRVTDHPAPDVPVGWTPDGKSILFRSIRTDFLGFLDKLYTVSPEGGFPTELPLPIAEEGSYSPDGTRLAYVPHPQWQDAWKRYRGGQTTPIWVANLSDSSVEAIPRNNSNDSNPMWIGNEIYFLSDRDGAVAMYAYDLATRTVRPVVAEKGWDIKSASAGPGAIVYETVGALHLYDLATRQSKVLHITVAGDFPELRAHFVTVDPAKLKNYSLSPTGSRALFEAWGEIFTVPTDKGDVRNITRSPAVADRDPSWSPDGRSIACFSDASGEYALELHDQNGMGKTRRIDLGQPPSFFYSPIWSPDSKRIAYTDKRGNLWYVDATEGAHPVKVDSGYFEDPAFDQAWSPDSKWLAYVKMLPSHMHAVFLYALDQKKPVQITDGMSDTLSPRFDKNGKSLYFSASTDIGLGASGFDMSGDSRPSTRSVYVVVLAADLPSPLAPESDEEKPKDEKKGDKDAKSDAREEKKDDKKDEKKDDKKDEKPVVVKIDLAGIGQRILALPIPARNYSDIEVGKTGILFLAENPLVHLPTDEEDVPRTTLWRFELTKRKAEKFLDEVNEFTVSLDGEKLLYRKTKSFTVAATDAPPTGSGEPKPGFGPLRTAGIEVKIEPRALWKQVWDETWRIERDFFYDPHHHGLDLAKVKKKYEPFLAGVASRSELNYLFVDSLGEMTVGHMFVGGGDQPSAKHVAGGLLGADYTVENGRYRFSKIYQGENWNPDMKAPLTQPGVNVKAGEYLLAVDGRELKSSDSVYGFFEGKADKQVVITVGAGPVTAASGASPVPRGSGPAPGKDSRDLTVVPVESEYNLRWLAWVDGNRRKVDELTHGRVAYVYMPNTADRGFERFNRYFFAQVGKEAVIIDERNNEGGQLADYVIDCLRRPLMSKVATRDGADWSSPSEAIYGPKVMITNEMAGSGGDALPWYFRKAGLGPIVGTRTWGGLVGIGGTPQLIDGGVVQAPHFALYGMDGEWEVENRGIPPDIEVQQDPAAVRKGHDPQLEKAVEVVMAALKDHPVPQPKRPAYPNYHKDDGLGEQ